MADRGCHYACFNRPSTFASDLREGAYTGAFPVVAFCGLLFSYWEDVISLCKVTIFFAKVKVWRVF